MDPVTWDPKPTSSSTGWQERVRSAQWVRTPVIIFLITRLGILLVAYLGAGLIPDSVAPPPYHLRGTDNLLLDIFGSRWDTGFYVSIAEEGYRYEGVPLPSVPFFPLLPLAMRAVTPLVGDTVLAGIMISNVALLLAAILFYRLVVERWDSAVAQRAVWYFLIFPTAFFGSAVYTESLFLLAAIGALYFARRGFWEVAALLGIAAALTRFVGLIVAPMLLLEWRQQRQAMVDRPRASYASLLAPVVVPLGTLAYMVFLNYRFGDPLAFVRGAQAWARQPQSPLLTVTTLFDAPAGGWAAAFLAGRVHLDNWLDFLFVLIFLVIGLVLLYQRQYSEGTYVTLAVVLALSSGLLMSQRRYMWICFPAFILLARWGERPWLDRLITTVSLVFLALFTVLFANGYWVG